MHRGQNGGLSFGPEGVTLDPDALEKRLEQLTDGPLHAAGWLFSSLDPVEYEDKIEELLVYLARYMRVSPIESEEQPMTRLYRWFSIVSRFIKAESGVKEGSREQDETEWM